jgi:hypothetical protein
MTLEQITLHKTEALKLLQHILEIRTAVNRAFDRYYQGDRDAIKDQLLAMKSEVDQILFYFESTASTGPCRRQQRCAVGCPALGQPCPVARVWRFWHLPAGRGARAPVAFTMARTNTDAELTSVGS